MIEKKLRFELEYKKVLDNISTASSSGISTSKSTSPKTRLRVWIPNPQSSFLFPSFQIIFPSG